MEFKIDTARLVAMLDDVEKGVGNSKIIPITEYLQFKLEGEKLSITSTDSTNFITREANGISGEDGELIIHADSIIRLAERTTVKEMSFADKGDHVKVTGNGVYKVGKMDEEYPSYEFDESSEKFEVDVDALKETFRVNEPSVAKDMLTPVLSGYKVGDMTITTDGIKMAINKTSLVEGIEFLLTQKMVDLISVIKDKTATIQKDGSKILIKSDGVTIFGNELEGIEDYPDITPLLELEHEGNVLVNKKNLISSLDRLIIFSDPFDNNGVTMHFKEDVLELSDLKRNSVETVKYTEVKKAPDAPVDVTVNVQYLKDLLSVIKGDDVSIFYAQELPIKIEENSVTQILSTMDLDEEGEE